MDQSASVRGVQGFAGPDDNPNRFAHIELAATFYLFAERISLHVFADDIGVSVGQHAEIEDGGDLWMSEIAGDLRFDLKAILRPRLGDRARAYEFDCDFLASLVRSHKNHARSALIDHTLQPVTHVDHIRDRLDVPQFDKAVTAKLLVRRVTLFARHAFTHDIVWVVDGHGASSLSDNRTYGAHRTYRTYESSIFPSPQFFITARAFRFNPSSFARLTALLRKRAENSSCDISIISGSFGSTTPSRGSKRPSAVSFEKRDHGHTS